MASIALVVLDTLRKDRFDQHFDWLPGRRFECAYSTANWTVPAHAALFTGQYAPDVGIHPDSLILDHTGDVLAEQLSTAGYDTRGLSANPFASQRYGWDRGFDEFAGPIELLNPNDENLFDWYEFLSDTENKTALTYPRALLSCIQSDAPTLQSLKRGVELYTDHRGMHAADSVPDDGASVVHDSLKETSASDDEFLFVNLMEAHAPYDPPQPYSTEETPVRVEVEHGFADGRPVDGTRKAYDGAVRYLSDIYEDIFEELIDQYEYVITCADHGELLGEHGGRWNHVYGVYPELVNVPLVVSGHGLDGNCDTPVSLLDVHATVLDIAGIEAESRGQSLLNPVEGTDRVTQYLGTAKFVANRLNDQDYSSERLAAINQPLSGILTDDGQYAYETPERFVTPEGVHDDLRSRLTDRIASIDTDANTDTEVELSTEAEEQLHDLGYL